MNVSRLTMEGFLVHDATIVDLPSTGIVVVTGPNGGGKSSLIEAVSYACWGKTLRGASPWRVAPPGAGGRVLVVGQLGGGQEAQVERIMRGGNKHVVWTAGGSYSSASYDTTTKAQAALEEHIGAWDVWRRTHVFSSQDAAHFSTATDKERKQLLESILGLERFDRALARCREEARQLAVDRAVADKDVAVSAAALEGAAARLRDAHRRLQLAEADVPDPAPTGDPDKLEADARRAEEQAVRFDAEAKVLREREREAIAAASGKGGDLRSLQARVALLQGRSACPTCEQTVTPLTVGLIRDAMVAEERRVREAEVVGRTAARRAREDAEEREDEARAMRARVHALRLDASKIRSALAEAQHRAEVRKAAKERAASDVAQAEEMDRAAEAVLEGARLRLLRSEGRLAVLAAVDDVLGFKGVRAHILGKCLAGLEASATVWLTRLAYDMMVLRLQPYSEKKAGGLTEAISIKVGRRADGDALREYDSLSGGERRRVDVSLLLALAETAAVAHGRQPGTLFFDEVFDALDPSGVEAVGEALGDLASNRCVVVISHSEALVESLPVVLRLRAESGVIRRA